MARISFERFPTHLSATASVERAGQGASLDDALSAAAVDAGTAVGNEASGGSLVDVLSTQGYEPRVDEDVIVLANCPSTPWPSGTPSWSADSTAHSCRASPMGSGAAIGRPASSRSPSSAA